LTTCAFGTLEHVARGAHCLGGQAIHAMMDSGAVGFQIIRSETRMFALTSTRKRLGPL
jgi:hypothetical protein